ncbi:MAG: glycosyltransferase family 2 protein, partial [Patescibacteria group bacterium]
STDGSLEVVTQQQKNNPRLVKAHLSLINIGKGAAVRMGLKLATGDIFIIQDADLELDPREYPNLLGPILNQETEVVYGSRFLNGNSNIGIVTVIANWVLATLTNILYGSRLSDMETAYKVITAKVAAKLHLRSVSFDFEPEITAQILINKFKITEVPIGYIPRNKHQGKKINIWDGIIAILTLVRFRFYKPDELTVLDEGL